MDRDGHRAGLSLFQRCWPPRPKSRHLVSLPRALTRLSFCTGLCASASLRCGTVLSGEISKWKNWKGAESCMKSREWGEGCEPGQPWMMPFTDSSIEPQFHFYWIFYMLQAPGSSPPRLFFHVTFHFQARTNWNLDSMSGSPAMIGPYLAALS